MLRRPPLFSALVLTFITVCFAGCRDRQTLVQQANAANTLILANGTEPADLDPQIVTGSPESRLVQALFEGLVRYHPETLDPLPGVAERWELAEDSVTYTFFLRAEAIWSDGKPVTARDFHRAYERMLSPIIASENAENLYFLEGAADFHQGRSQDFTSVGSRVTDDHTLELKAARPTPFFIRMLSARGWFPLPIHVLENHGALERKGTPWTRAEHIVGNGPFVLDSWRPNQSIEMSRSPTYWNRETVGLDKIHFLPMKMPTPKSPPTAPDRFTARRLSPSEKLKPIDVIARTNCGSRHFPEHIIMPSTSIDHRLMTFA